jgi:putative transposase
LGLAVKGQAVTEAVAAADPADERSQKSSPAAPVLDEELARQLVDEARTKGVSLLGPGGLLGGLTKQVLETSLEAEMTDHLGYDRHAVEGRNSGNSRNGRRSKTVITEVGPVELDVPRDRDGSFEPQIVRKRQRRMAGIEPVVLSLSAKGLTHGEISAHFAEVYQASVSKDTVTRITDTVLEQMGEWQNRPLDAVYPVLFIDALFVKIRDGQVANRPIYTVVGVTVEGERDILGLWVGQGGEGAKFWATVLTELKNRGVEDVCIVVCDGLKHLPEVIGTIWPQAIVQTCILHLIRQTFRLSGRQHWDHIARAIKPIYTAPTESAARLAFEELADTWGRKYPAITRLWESAWAEFVPFLAYDVEVRRVICSTNAIESLNARLRRSVRARGHFPSEQAAIKCLYLTLRSLDPTGRGRARWITRWKPALNAFAITFEGRIIPNNP